jgi:hypothetical protein
MFAMFVILQNFCQDVERPEPRGLRQRAGASKLGVPMRRGHGPEAGRRVQVHTSGPGDQTDSDMFKRIQKKASRLRVYNLPTLDACQGDRVEFVKK